MVDSPRVEIDQSVARLDHRRRLRLLLQELVVIHYQVQDKIRDKRHQVRVLLISDPLLNILIDPSDKVTTAVTEIETEVLHKIVLTFVSLTLVLQRRFPLEDKAQTLVVRICPMTPTDRAHNHYLRNHILSKEQVQSVLQDKVEKTCLAVVTSEMTETRNSQLLIG